MEYQGIDVAKWQGNIDWKKVKNAGKAFAILKITKKGNEIEESFEKNYKGAMDNGIEVGGYRYVYATTESKAKAEAEGMIKVLKGRKMPCGIWIDVEDATIKKVGTKQLSLIIDTEAKILQNAGYKVGIYCNKDWYTNVLDHDYLAKKYPFWIARYPTSDKGNYNAKSSLAPRSYAKAWQYSSKGSVSGITGNVDLDVAFENLVTLMGNTATPTVAKPATVPVSNYYPAYKGSSTSIDTVLTAIGADKEFDKRYANWRKRVPIAKKNGFPQYSGTTVQNLALIKLAKNGGLKK